MVEREFTGVFSVICRERFLIKKLLFLTTWWSEIILWLKDSKQRSFDPLIPLHPSPLPPPPYPIHSPGEGTGNEFYMAHFEGNFTF